MDHAAYLIDLVDESGAVVGAKKRADVDKQTDFFHTVFVILVTPENMLALSTIPERDDLPNLYPHTFGTTLATIRRHGESSYQASQRALQRELGLFVVNPEHLGDTILQLPDGRRDYASIYRLVHALPATYNHLDIKNLRPIAKSELIAALTHHPEQFAPTFLAIWQLYKDVLMQSSDPPQDDSDHSAT